MHFQALKNPLKALSLLWLLVWMHQSLKKMNICSQAHVGTHWQDHLVNLLMCVQCDKGPLHR